MLVRPVTDSLRPVAGIPNTLVVYPQRSPFGPLQGYAIVIVPYRGEAKLSEI